jgi:hypothetical protein
MPCTSNSIIKASSCRNATTVSTHKAKRAILPGVNFKISRSQDLVFFPFRGSQFDGEMELEQMMMNRYNLDTCDLDEKRTWDKTGDLFIFGHGTKDDDSKHLISGGRGEARTAWDVADDIAEMRFPQGNDNQIVVWSCYSGVVGGFAQLLTLHLINKGYTGKRVWGSLKYTGTIDGSRNLRVSDSEASNRVIRLATRGDVTCYTGA